MMVTDIAQIGLPDNFLPGLKTIVVSDAAKDKIPADCKAIILLCELNQNEKGESINRQELYGIELAKKLRMEGNGNLIIFTSFLSRAQVYKLHSQSEILEFVGHGFVQLPAKPQDFIDEAKRLIEGREKSEKLSSLELKDVQLFACHPDGIVNAKIHQIPSLPEKLQTLGADNVKQKLVNCIREIHSAFQVSYEGYLSAFEKEFPVITKDNVESAIDSVTEKAKDLIKDYKRKTGEPITNDKAKPWKLLLLDDELDKESKLVKALEANGVDVICTSHADKAIQALENDDTLRGKISVILTDYRLYEQAKDGMQVQQSIQGYSFLQKVGEKYYSKVMSAIVYSSMSRQFLLDNLNTFKIRTEKYSKGDLKTGDTGANNYLVSRIIEVGDKNYETMLALPMGNKGWRNHLHKHYLTYRSQDNYETEEREICDFCTNWITRFRNNQHPETPMIKGDAFNAKIKESAPDTMKRFMAYYKTRRLAEYLYLYFENRNKQDIRAEVADILIPPGKERKKPKTIDGYFSQVLGISLTEFPLGATMEDLRWFEYDMGVKVLDSYTKYRDIFNQYETLIGDFISGDNSLMGFLKENNFCIKGKAENEITFNPQTYNPYLFDKMDVGFCIEIINGKTKEMNKAGTEAWNTLLQQLRQAWS